ncbi:MAG: hypothetical protein K6F50_09170 [Kiritimatiellae bacterium]|nr:hypothetical protein [Kiritimatiellia bacterium]
MAHETPESIGGKMNGLGIWDSLAPYNWIVKPRGTVFPYFCSILKGDGKPVAIRLLLIEGWQTFHDYVRTTVDRNWGFYLSPMEMPHFELVIFSTGKAEVFRHDPGYLPMPVKGPERELVSKLLWEAYGVMMRVESDRELPLKFASQRAMFARVETESGWEDRPVEIPPPRPHVEKVLLKKDTVDAVKDLPFAESEKLDLDFRILPGVVTKEARPRCAYALLAIDGETGEIAISERMSVSPDNGLRGLWEGLASRVLDGFVRMGRVPGELRVCSGRVFRLLRPICPHIPFKLSLHDALPRLEKAMGGTNA